MKPPEYYSLLIETVIDGEATEAERNELFDAIAADAGLRREFDEAVQFSATLSSARAAYTPPPELAAAVFAEAGIAVAPVSAGLSLMQTGVALVVGAMLTASLFLFPWKTVFSPEQAANSAQSSGSSPENKSSIGAIAASSRTNIPQHRPEIKSSIGAVSASSRTNIPQHRPEIKSSIGAGGAQSPADASQHHPENRGASSVITECDDLKAIAATYTHRNRDIARVSIREAGTDFTPNTFGDYRFWLRGMMGIQQFPERPEASKLPLLNAEGALAIFWQTSPTQSIGVEAGLEELPLYLVQQMENGGTRYELAEKNYWIAGWYRSEFDIAGIPFFGATGIGASEAGPLAKLQAGLLHSFSHNVHGLIGVEFTEQFYRYSGEWQAAQRLALTLSLGITIQE